jgi:hypothetical protein
VRAAGFGRGVCTLVGALNSTVVQFGVDGVFGGSAEAGVAERQTDIAVCGVVMGLSAYGKHGSASVGRSVTGAALW